MFINIYIIKCVETKKMVECVRCGHIWNAWSDAPKQCNNCQSRFWNRKYQFRPDKKYEEFILKNPHINSMPKEKVNEQSSVTVAPEPHELQEVVQLNPPANETENNTSQSKSKKLKLDD